jgi:glycosyltransferase involved in cell wall biosynthesis
MAGEPMRVLMTADAVGGVWTYALDLAAGLTAHGIEIVLATMGPLPNAEQIAAARRIDRLELVTSEFKLEWMDDPWSDVPAAGDWLLGLEARYSPDLIHLNGYAHGALPFRAPKLVVGHSCVMSWADAVPGAIDQRFLATYGAHVRAGLHAANHVAAPTQAMLWALQRHYGRLPRTSIIHNGRPAERFFAGRKEPFVFTAGRLWDRAKNVEAVAAIAPRLTWPVALSGAASRPPDGTTAGGSSSPTVAIGGGDERLPHVRLLGVLRPDELAEWLSRASIFALPARYEPFGLLPLEAALSGCALVLGDIPSLREVWGDAAEYVNPDDHVGLARTVTALTRSRASLAERASAARSRAERYTASRMAASYAALYLTLAAESRASRSIACAS